MSFLQGISRPARLAGVVLIGVGLVAAVIGVVTATSGGGQTQNAAPSTSASAAPGPGPGSAPPPPAPSVSTSSAAPAPPPPGTTPAPVPPPGPAGPKPGQTDAKWVPVRVYNNGTVQGLAARAADEFRADGWNVTQVAPYSSGIIPTTTAYYTPGTDEETAAKALAATFGMQAQERFEGIKGSSPGVIVILTNDYQGTHTKDGVHTKDG
jgi:hypothetical protein